jgi:hypothetical protein
MTASAFRFTVNARTADTYTARIRETDQPIGLVRKGVGHWTAHPTAETMLDGWYSTRADAAQALLVTAQRLAQVEAIADAAEPVEADVLPTDEERVSLVERVAAVLDATIVPIASVRPYGEGRALVTIGDRVIGDPQRYADTGSIAGRHYSARSALARAGYRETPTGGAQIIVADREPVDEPGPEVDDPREQPRPVEWSEVPGPEVSTRSAGSRLSNAAVLSMLRNGGSWAEQDPRVVGPDRA